MGLSAPEPAFPRLVCQVDALSARARILKLPHPVCLVAALADSPVSWSRRSLSLSDNLIDIESVAGVSWPSSLEYVSLLACSELQSMHPRGAASC